MTRERNVFDSASENVIANPLQILDVMGIPDKNLLVIMKDGTICENTVK